MKKIKFMSLLFSLILTSCHHIKTNDNNLYSLEKSDKILSFELDDYTKNMIRSLFLYTDVSGKEFLTFQNTGKNEILFYDINSKKLEFKVEARFEGNNGVGFFLGYYINNLDSIFLTISNIEEIALIDHNGNVIDKFQYQTTSNNLYLKMFYSITNLYHPIVLINNKIFIMPGCNRWAEENPVCAIIDLESRSVDALTGFKYPTFTGADNKAKTAGIENHVSRCYDGKQFVYSFHFDENISIVSIDHKSIKRVKVKSKYIDKVNLIDDYGNLTAEDMASNPNYGNLLYDEFRNIYYRIAYPKTEIEKGIRGSELLVYGRKNFSIIILDENFNVIGETLFPDYTYNSVVMFIRKDGLYISSSHYLNPEFSDDILSFQRFDLVKK